MKKTKSYDLSLKRDALVDNEFTPLMISPSLITTIVQTRDSMTHEGIEELVYSIVNHGQQTPGIAFAIPKDKFTDYYKEWVSKFFPESEVASNSVLVCIEEKKSEYVLILVAGHRRHKAITQIHKKDQKFLFKIRIKFDGTVDEAMQIQLNENLSERPSKASMARFIHSSWLGYICGKSKPSVAAFARMLDLNPTFVSANIAFSNLPPQIARMYIPEKPKDGIPFNVLVEISRMWRRLEEAGKVGLRDGPTLEGLVKFCQDMILVRNLTSTEMRARIHEYEKIFTQDGLFTISLQLGSIEERATEVVDAHLASISSHAKRIARGVSVGLLTSGDEAIHSLNVNTRELHQVASTVSSIATFAKPRESSRRKRVKEIKKLVENV